MNDNNKEPILERYTREYANDPEYIAEGLAIKITEEMLEHLSQRGLNQTWLASQMGVSRSHVSKILNAQPNMTLLTIAKIAVALGTTPDVCIDTWGLSWILPPTKNVLEQYESIDAASDPIFEMTPEPATA